VYIVWQSAISRPTVYKRLPNKTSYNIPPGFNCSPPCTPKSTT